MGIAKRQGSPALNTTHPLLLSLVWEGSTSAGPTWSTVLQRRSKGQITLLPDPLHYTHQTQRARGTRTKWFGITHASPPYCPQYSISPALPCPPQVPS